jgi:hypothetical protein
MIYLSYVPLLSTRIGMVRPPEEKQNLLNMILEASHSYPIQAIGWMSETETESFPVLFLPHAHEIQKHMQDWAADKTDKYFTLVWQAHGKGYTLVILPDFNRSARRYHATKGTDTPLTILGHLFPYRVDTSVDFRTHFLEGKTSIKVGFSEKAPRDDGTLEKLSCLKMRVSPFEALPADQKALVAAHFPTQH